MSLHRRAARRDDNETEIVDALRAAGASVLFLAVKGAGDLLVGFAGRNVLMETKQPKGPRGGSSGGGSTRPGQGGDGTLTKAQIEFRAGWRGAPPVIVRTPAEALAAIGAATADMAPEQPPATRPRVRAKPAACAERTGHRVPDGATSCACGAVVEVTEAAALAVPPVTWKCSGCSLAYADRDGLDLEAGVAPPIHWDENRADVRPQPLCPGYGKPGIHLAIAGAAS